MLNYVLHHNISVKSLSLTKSSFWCDAKKRRDQVVGSSQRKKSSQNKHKPPKHEILFKVFQNQLNLRMQFTHPKTEP